MQFPLRSRSDKPISLASLSIIPPLATSAGEVMVRGWRHAARALVQGHPDHRRGAVVREDVLAMAIIITAGADGDIAPASLDGH